MEKYRGQAIRFLKSRIRTLLVPYFVFSILFYLCRLFLDMLGIYKGIAFKQFVDVLFFNNCTDSLEGIVQWFLPAIWFTEIFAFYFFEHTE